MSASAERDVADAGLSALLRAGTQALHTQAERSGIVADLLRGTITRDAYALYLRNLAPAYRELERGLERRRDEVIVACFARPELYRTAVIEADLTVLAGAGWSAALPILPASAAYAALIASAAREQSGGALVAHAYVRYFGDLSGGQILRRLLARSLGLPATALSVCDFPGIDDLDGFKRALRETVDQTGRRLAAPRLVVEEALRGFRANIDVSAAVQAHCRTSPAASA